MIRRFLKFVLGLGIVGGLGAWGFFAVKNKDININRWFVGGQMQGVDVSSYQTEVDFRALQRHGIKFAYIKATEGSSHVDASFAEKWAEAEEAGMPVGAYHYFSYESSGASQATNYIEAVGDLTGRLIPAVDLELSSDIKTPEKSAVVNGLKAFLAVLEEEYGVKPLLYAERSYYEQYLKDDFAGYPRWVRNVYYPVWIDAGEDWLLWQYSDRGELDGYGGEKYIDLDAVNSKFGLDALKMP